jgi:hypothetical protein
LRLRCFPTCLVAILSLWSAGLSGQQPQICSEWQECRQMALDAAARGHYERFHDLAWRTVQTGPRNDPALMFLLTRAQALSGRPTDALVMLRRLVDTGVAESAITDPDFSRVRELAAWPQLEAALAAGASRTRQPAPAPVAPAVAPAAEAALRAPPADPAPVPAPGPARRGLAAPARTAAPPAPRAPALAAPPTPAPVAPRAPDAPAALPAPVVLPVEPVAARDAARFSAPRFRPAGLAFDAVSQRFVVGDALARKLIVIGVGPGRPDDLVRAESAQFDNVAAVSIDARRGDLWVASAMQASVTSALHKLQLVSGRPLKMYRVPASLGPARVVDLAVQPSGGVVALDAAGSRLLWLARDADDVTVALQLQLSGLRSMASSGSEDVLHIAHDAGIARVDLKARSVTALAGARGLDLSGFEAIRTHRDSIVGLQPSSAGPLQLVRLKLNATGRAVRSAAVIDRAIVEGDGRVVLNITGNELYYLAIPAPPAGAAGDAADRSAMPLVIRHLTLR